MRGRRWRAIAAALVAVTTGLAAWACDAGSMAGDAMVDAGGMLADAGEALRDAMGSDAAAQDPPVEVACEAAVTSRIEVGTTWTETTYWYAEVSEPGLDPDDLRTVEVLTCDREYFGASTPSSECPDGAVCTGSLPAFDPLECFIGNGAEIEAGRVRVLCGSRTRSGTTDGSGTERDSGQRWRRVRLTLVR